MDNWLQITFSMPVFIAVVLALVIIGCIGTGIVFLNRYRRRIIKLINNYERLSKTVHGAEYPDAISSEGRQAYEYFLQNISHEVSNPLQSILTNLDNMQHCSPDETDRRQQYYQIISTDIRRLVNLTERLQKIAMLEIQNQHITREAVNLKAVIETVIMSQSDYAEKRGVHIKYHGAERLDRVWGDRGNLEQVFLNLIGNSIKYAKERGGEVVISVQDGPDALHVRVIDDGIGIPEEDLPFIFDVAYRSPETLRDRRKGTGLGLWIVKRIIERHGGQISVHSQLGRGTTVTFDLPKYKPSSETQPE